MHMLCLSATIVAFRLTAAAVQSHGDGLANTAMIFHGNRLLALHEGDKPYVVRCSAFCA